VPVGEARDAARTAVADVLGVELVPALEEEIAEWRSESPIG
jgi:hypothetical protein